MRKISLIVNPFKSSVPSILWNLQLPQSFRILSSVTPLSIFFKLIGLWLRKRAQEFVLTLNFKPRSVPSPHYLYPRLHHQPVYDLELQFFEDYSSVVLFTPFNKQSKHNCWCYCFCLKFHHFCFVLFSQLRIMVGCFCLPYLLWGSEFE